MKILKLSISILLIIFLAGCVTNGQNSLKVMDVGDYLSQDPVYLGEITPLQEPFSIKLRSINDAFFKYSNYEKAGNHLSLANVSGKYDTFINEENITEKLHSKKISYQFDFGEYGSRGQRYPSNIDNLKNPKELFEDSDLEVTKSRTLPTIVIAIQPTDGSTPGYPSEGNFLYGAFAGTFPEKKEVVLRQDQIFDDTADFLSDNDLKQVRFFRRKVLGETIWKGRQAIVIGHEAKYSGSDSSKRVFDFQINGYSLLDKYSGLVVLRDIVNELDGEIGAEFYSRQIIDISLDVSTPVLLN